MFLSQLPVLSKSALLLSGSDPPRDEIGLIPCPEARYNRSPIVMVENKLGVESWCVKFLLPYVHNKLLLYRQRRLWLDRQGTPGSESSSVYLCVRTSLEQVVWYSPVPLTFRFPPTALVDITCTLLLLNPDLTTAWNVRYDTPARAQTRRLQSGLRL